MLMGFVCCVQIVNPKGEMKGSAITGPVGKEAAELWPVSCCSPLSSIHTQVQEFLADVVSFPAYRIEFGGCYVSEKKENALRGTMLW